MSTLSHFYRFAPQNRVFEDDNWIYNKFREDQLFFQDEDSTRSWALCIGSLDGPPCSSTPIYSRLFKGPISPLCPGNQYWVYPQSDAPAYEKSRDSNRYHDWGNLEAVPREGFYREYGNRQHGFHSARNLTPRPGYNRMQSTAMGVYTFKGAGPMGHHRIYNPVDEQSGTDRRQLDRLGGRREQNYPQASVRRSNLSPLSRGAKVSWKPSSTKASANTRHARGSALDDKRTAPPSAWTRKSSDSNDARNSTPQESTSSSVKRSRPRGAINRTHQSLMVRRDYTSRSHVKEEKTEQHSSQKRKYKRSWKGERSQTSRQSKNTGEDSDSTTSDSDNDLGYKKAREMISSKRHIYKRTPHKDTNSTVTLSAVEQVKEDVGTDEFHREAAVEKDTAHVQTLADHEDKSRIVDDEQQEPSFNLSIKNNLNVHYNNGYVIYTEIPAAQHLVSPKPQSKTTEEQIARFEKLCLH